MAKRFIDTELFNDSWFMGLSKDAKIIWIYAITNCNHAGILKVNEKLIEFQTGVKSFLTVSKDLANCLIRLNESEYYLIPKFFAYQYPNYPEKTFRAADSAVNELRKYNLWDEENNNILKTYLSVSQVLTKTPSNSKGNSISKRKERFEKEVFAFLDYEKSMLEKFISYWTEPNKSKTKMRFELQPTWELNLRLTTWASKDKSFTSTPKGKHPDYYAQSYEKTLNSTQTVDYHKYLISLGFKKITAPGGTNWIKPKI